MRIWIAAAGLAMLAAPAAAETITVYNAAPGQNALALGEYKSTVPGAKVLNLDVGIGSAAFRLASHHRMLSWFPANDSP